MRGTPDRHANMRDRKLAKRKTSDAMRGERSVFEIQKAIVKRGKDAMGAITWAFKNPKAK